MLGFSVLLKYLVFKSCGLDGCSCTYSIVHSLCIFLTTLAFLNSAVYFTYTAFLGVFSKADI